MAGEWTLGRLGDCIILQSGGTPSKSRPDFWGGDVPWISAKDMKSFWIEDSEDHLTELGVSEATRIVDPGTTLMLIRGMTLHNDVPICRVRRSSAFNQDVKAVQPRAGTHSAFVPYLLLGIKDRLLSSVDSAGHGTGRLNTDTLLNLAVYRIPPGEQQAIACILGALDDKIELNRRRNRTLEAMARAIFQSWFVDFDPVKAKAAGRTPPGLSPTLAALFPDSFTDSPLGPIPTGWRLGTVGDVAEFNSWTLGKRDELDEIDYIEISEVMRGEIANITRYTRGTEPGRARRRLRHGDTALSTVRPDRGSYFLSIEPSPNLLASTGFAVLTAKNCHWAFAHVLVTREEFGQELGRLADGGAYPAVRPEVIAARPVVIPAESELLTNFEKAAQPLFLHAESSRKESRSLAALRDALLPKLISGELRVPDAERIVGRAV